MDKAQHIQEIVELLEKCNTETLISINQLNHVLVELSAAKLEYMIELAHLLFGEAFK